MSIRAVRSTISMFTCINGFSSHFCFLVCRDAEEQAEKIASEIENQPAYKERADLENGDEESRFAAVERPRSNSPDEVKANTGKYVAPGRRKNTQTGKLIRPALPLVSKRIVCGNCQCIGYIIPFSLNQLYL